MSRKEIEERLLTAESLDDVNEILTGSGIELSDKTKDELCNKITLLRKGNGDELSEDELTSVSGGRDYLTEGCAATVQPESNCWGTDGGCTLIHNDYKHEPTKHTCYICGAYMYVLDDNDGGPSVLYCCPKCGNETWSSRPGS